MLGVALRADGTKQDLLYVDGGPSTTGAVGKLRMQGKEVFRHAVVNISEAVIAAARAAGVALAQVDWFIPHQANQRILEGVARRLGIDETGWSPPWPNTPTPRRPRFRWRWTRPSPTAASSPDRCC